MCWLLLPRDTKLTASLTAQRETDTPLLLLYSSTFTTSFSRFSTSSFSLIHVTAFLLIPFLSLVLHRKTQGVILLYPDLKCDVVARFIVFWMSKQRHFYNVSLLYRGYRSLAGEEGRQESS